MQLLVLVVASGTETEGNLADLLLICWIVPVWVVKSGFISVWIDSLINILVLLLEFSDKNFPITHVAICYILQGVSFCFNFSQFYMHILFIGWTEIDKTEVLWSEEKFQRW